MRLLPYSLLLAWAKPMEAAGSSTPSFCSVCRCDPSNASAVCGSTAQGLIRSTPFLYSVPSLHRLRLAQDSELRLSWLAFEGFHDEHHRPALDELLLEPSSVACASTNGWLAAYPGLAQSGPLHSLALAGGELCHADFCLTTAQLSRLPQRVVGLNQTDRLCLAKKRRPATGLQILSQASGGTLPPDAMGIWKGQGQEVICRSSVESLPLRLSFLPLSLGSNSTLQHMLRGTGSVSRHLNSSFLSRLSSADSGFFLCSHEDPERVPEIKALPLRIAGPPVLRHRHRRREQQGSLFVEMVFVAQPRILLDESRLVFLYNHIDDGGNGTGDWREWALWRVELPFETGDSMEMESKRILDVEEVVGLRIHRTHKDACVSGEYVARLCNALGCAEINFTVAETPEHMVCRMSPRDRFSSLSPSAFSLLDSDVSYEERPAGSRDVAEARPAPQAGRTSAVLTTLAVVGALVLATLAGIRLYAWRNPGRLGRNGPWVKFVREGSADGQLVGGGADTSALVPNTNYVSWVESIRREKSIPVTDFARLTTVRLLGEGAFGERPGIEVYLVEERAEDGGSNGSEKSTDVGRLLAMKQLKLGSGEQMREMEREANVLLSLSHPNVVAFHGLTFKGDSAGLLFEFMEHGDLVAYLRNHNPDLQPSATPLSVHAMLGLCADVAGGLAYLAGRGLVHRDLAARNCLVTASDRSDKEVLVKISDFGMSRSVCGTSYYRMGSDTLVPVRWLPPESILYRKFTAESDVWSFGVCLWEIFSKGQIPWSEFSNSEVFDVVKLGRSLARPESCPERLFRRLIEPCWRIKPADRITAQQARVLLAELLREEKEEQDLDIASAVNSAQALLPPLSSADSPS